jgi:hypothetical protein
LSAGCVTPSPRQGHFPADDLQERRFARTVAADDRHTLRASICSETSSVTLDDQRRGYVIEQLAASNLNGATKTLNLRAFAATYLRALALAKCPSVSTARCFKSASFRRQSLSSSSD